MNMYIFLTFIATLFFGRIAALPVSSSLVDAGNVAAQRRAANTCGDPSLVSTFYGGFSIFNKAHAFNSRASWVSQDGGDGGDWQFEGPLFRAWKTPGQPSTFPLYVLSDSATTKFTFLLSTTGSPPTAIGFTAGAIIAYAYSTQICGSVPLFAVAKSPTGDHWWTTDTTERDEFINLNGWIDQGVVAYVLPLEDDIESG
ncbi:hypothetical protein GALMADRAFT_1359788, partial [Galerina marginata CBS 339.88]